MSDETPDIQSWIDPELEARVVAWVLGEASAFEAAELDRIIKEKPELGLFKRRIEAAHDLVAVASRLEMDQLRMSEERRRKLLEKLGQPSAAPVPVTAMPQKAAVEKRRPILGTIAKIAACLIVLSIVMGLLFPAVRSSQMAARISSERNTSIMQGMRSPDTAMDTRSPGKEIPSFRREAASETAMDLRPESVPPRLAALDELKKSAEDTDADGQLVKDGAGSVTLSGAAGGVAGGGGAMGGAFHGTINYGSAIGNTARAEFGVAQADAGQLMAQTEPTTAPQFRGRFQLGAQTAEADGKLDQQKLRDFAAKVPVPLSQELAAPAETGRLSAKLDDTKPQMLANLSASQGGQVQMMNGAPQMQQAEQQLEQAQQSASEEASGVKDEVDQQAVAQASSVQSNGAMPQLAEKQAKRAASSDRNGGAMQEAAALAQAATASTADDAEAARPAAAADASKVAQLTGGNNYTGATTISGGSLNIASGALKSAAAASHEGGDATGAAPQIATTQAAVNAPAAPPLSAPAGAVAGYKMAPSIDSAGQGAGAASASASLSMASDSLAQTAPSQGPAEYAMKGRRANHPDDPALGDVPVAGEAFRNVQPADGKTRSEMLSPVDKSWNMPVHKFSGAAQASPAPPPGSTPIVGSDGQNQGYVAYGSPISTVSHAQLGAASARRGLTADEQKKMNALLFPGLSAGEISACHGPYSTFSLHVSDVSFNLAREALAKGQMPDPESIRPEEFYNAFDYGAIRRRHPVKKLPVISSRRRIRFCSSATS